MVTRLPNYTCTKGEDRLIIADLEADRGAHLPGAAEDAKPGGWRKPDSGANFALGHVTLEPSGGQVPWHNQEQEEIYFSVEGTGEMCLGEESAQSKTGQAVYIPPRVFHQLTNTGDTPMRMIYCYGPAGDVAHWRQELEGTLPRAGVDVPPLPEGAQPQCTEKPRNEHSIRSASS